MERILIVSDEAPSEVVSAALEERGFAVTSSNRETAYVRLRESHFDIVVVDVAGACEGADFVGRVRRDPKLVQTFILTLAEWGTGQPMLALSNGADAFEPKPIDAERLVSAVKQLLGRQTKTAVATARGEIENHA